MKLALHWKIIIGLALGVIWALLSSYLGWSQFTIDWIDPFGQVFIRLLKLIAVPLVLFSIIKGITELSDVSSLGRIGLKTLGTYLLTTVTAVTVGLVLVNLLHPGNGVALEQREDNRIKYELWARDAGVEVLDGECLSCEADRREQIDRVAAAMKTETIDPALAAKMDNAGKVKESGPLQFVVDMIPGNLFFSLSNNSAMLQVIVFALFFGICLIMIPADRAGPVIKLVDGANEVFLKMVDVIMKGAPFFVFALLAGVISKMAGDDPSKVLEIFKGLAFYSIAVVIGLAFLVFIFYPLLVALITRKITYREFFKALSPAQLLAFSTSSSVATLPVTMECVHDNLKVSEKVSSFVLPIGATVNMDGTSLYQAVAVVFLAQFHLVDLDLTQQLTIVLTATLASIGSAAVPSAGLIMMMIVLESVGLNPAWIAIIFPVDRILDMCRTVVNVTGDASVSAIIAKAEGQLNR